MTSPAEGIKAILTSLNAIDGASGWKGKVGGLGDSAKEVAIIDSGGRGGEAKVAIDYPSVQVIVKGEKAAGGYTAAFDKARAVYDLLHGIDTPNAQWDELVSCIAVNTPAWLGRNDRDEPMFSVNFRLITEPSNQGNRPY